MWSPPFRVIRNLLQTAAGMARLRSDVQCGHREAWSDTVIVQYGQGFVSGVGGAG